MNKINWSQKLSSRKFWAAVVGFVTPLMVMLNYTDSQITQITALIMAGANLIGYMIAEGLADSNRQ